MNEGRAVKGEKCRIWICIIAKICTHERHLHGGIEKRKEKEKKAALR